MSLTRRLHQRCLAQGLDVTWPPTHHPEGVREMHVRHSDGHVLRMDQRQQIESDRASATDVQKWKL